MKICYLARPSSLNVEHWLRYFAGKGHEVQVLSFEPPRNRIEGVHYHVFPANKKILYFSLIFKLFQFRRIINSITPDLIDAHYVLKYGFMAALIGFHPLVINALGSDILVQAKKNPILRLITRYALEKCDAIVCRSSAMKEAIIELGIEDSKIQVILDGIDTERFQPMPKDMKLKEEHGIGPLDPVVISTRSFRSVYNIETLIRAVPLVLAEVPETKFIISGRGKSDYLQEMARNLNVLENIRFVGWIPHEELPRYLCTSDIYVSTSLSDSTHNSLLEAMACQIASVVTDITANKQWINDGENGFLIPIEDPVKLAGRIIILVKDSEKRKSFGQMNRGMVIERSGREAEHIKMEKVYQDLLE